MNKEQHIKYVEDFISELNKDRSFSVFFCNFLTYHKGIHFTQVPKHLEPIAAWGMANIEGFIADGRSAFMYEDIKDVGKRYKEAKLNHFKGYLKSIS